MNTNLRPPAVIRSGGGFGSLFGKRFRELFPISSLPLQPPKKQKRTKERPKHFPRPEETSETAPAVITAEAALALPAFLFFCYVFLSVFLTLRQGSILWYEADREAARRAETSFQADEAAGEDITVTRNWEAGLLPVQQAAAVRRAWTGRFMPEPGESGRYVIVTDHASVYHLTEACTYLTLSVRQISRADVAAARNRDGKKYYPCERCGLRAGDGSCYITEAGRRYHTDRNCSGLKRSWRWILLSDCGLPACSRCGG